MLDRFLNRLPTVTMIREGHRLEGVSAPGDLDLPVAATARVGHGGVPMTASILPRPSR